MEIRLHWTLIAFVLFIAWVYSAQGRRALLDGLLWVAAVFGAVLVHELAHCVVARRRGAIVDDILLTPLAGFSQIRQMPEAPGDQLAIALVGPLTNLAMAVVFMAAGLGVGVRLWPPTLFAGPWLARLLWMNVLLGAFNLLPALPMDGGRVLRAALARRLDPRTATRVSVEVARVCATAMIVIGIFYDFWLVLIGIFVLLAAGAEDQGAGQSGDHRDHPPTAPTAPPSHDQQWHDWPGAAFGSSDLRPHRAGT